MVMEVSCLMSRGSEFQAERLHGFDSYDEPVGKSAGGFTGFFLI